MTRMLASVRNPAEARLVAHSGADIIDLKEPSAGALGALTIPLVADVVASLRGVKPVSATVGDLPMEPAALIPAVLTMASTGVDYVKIGFFPGGDWQGVLADLEPLAHKGIRLIAVMFADHAPEIRWLTQLARAGFAGAMLDTADKQRGSLCAVATHDFLRTFVMEAARLNLLCGLAGSLRTADIPALLELRPDYLGFRGALCGGVRTDDLDPHCVSELASVLRAHDDTLISLTARQPHHVSSSALPEEGWIRDTIAR